MLVYGMGCYYTGLNVSNQDGLLVYGWGFRIQDVALVYRMEC